VVSFEPVDVYIEDTKGDPVQGVLVKIYDPTGTTFYTQAISDENGAASFLLETLSYTMRFYKFHTGFTQPQHFDVLPLPERNVFDVLAELFELPIATDPRLCRCSGFFRDVTGAPKQWLDMHIVAEFQPILLDDTAVVTEEKHIRTDENGYVQVDLIRGANYYVNLEAMGSANLRRLCQVPDAASANLPDMLFPRVDRIVFSPDPINVPVGGTLDVVPTVYDSAGRPLIGTASADVRWTMEDSTIASVGVMTDKLVLRGNLAGSTHILATRVDNSIVKIPDTPIEGVPMDVTVA
jgi:hypothetical protein